MKYLLLIAIVLMVVWLLRGSRRTGSGNSTPPQPRAGAGAQQQEMIQCPVCRVHVPRTDALPGPDGQLYCCAEHCLRGKA